MSQTPDTDADAIEAAIQRDPLVVAFGDTPKTRILAVLLDAAPRGLNPSSIVENAALGRTTWYNVRDDLLDAGLIDVDEEATEQAGNSTIYRIVDGERAEWLGKLRDYTGADLRDADLKEDK